MLVNVNMKSLSSTHLLESTDNHSNNHIISNSSISNRFSSSFSSSSSVKETNKIILSYDPKNKLQILNQFEIIREIGIGTHSKVKLGYDLSLCKPVAIKIMNRKERKRSQFKFEQNLKIKQEINCLKLISKHRNIIQLFEILDDFQSRKIYLIMEYCPGGEIKWCPETVNELDASGPPQWSFQRVREMVRDVILGLEYLHHRGIIHRDIKPANLLISYNNIVKISDFSISVIINESHQNNSKYNIISSPSTTTTAISSIPSSSASSYLSGTTTTNTEVGSNIDYLQLIKTEGTPAFFAPELCLGYDAWNKFKLPSNDTTSNSSSNTNSTTNTDNYFLSTKIDVWALGITTFCLLFGMLPFKSKFELELFNKIINDPVKYPEYVDLMTNNISEITSIQEYELAKDFIEQLLIKNPFNRISVTECKNHPFICFDFNNKIINDSRTKDSKLLQKLNFLTKQDEENIVTLDNNMDDNENNITQFCTDTDAFNKGHKIDSFLTPTNSLTMTKNPSLVNIHKHKLPTTNPISPIKKSIKSLNKKTRNKRNKSKEMLDNNENSDSTNCSNNNNNNNNENYNNDDYDSSSSNTMVNLPINSSFASLDSFYIENFAMTKLIQEDSEALNSKFKSASQPIVTEPIPSTKSSQNDLTIPRRRRRRHSKNKKNIGNIYNDNNSIKTNSSIRLNIHDLNSQPSSRIPSNHKLLQSPTFGQNFSSFSSNLTSSSNGSVNKDLYKGRISPNSPLNSDLLPRSKFIDSQLESPISSSNPISFDNKDKEVGKRSFNKDNQYNEKDTFNTVYKSSINKNINSPMGNSRSPMESDVSLSPSQPSYHITSTDASVVSFRNMPQFSDLIPSGPITPLESSSSTMSSTCSSSTLSSSISTSSSYSSSSSNHDSDSGEELILNIGHSGHIRRQLSQQAQNLNSANTNDRDLVRKNSIVSTPSRKIYSRKESPQSTSNKVSDTNSIDTENIINGKFIGGDMDSRKLLKDVLNHNSCTNNNKENMDNKI